MRILLVEDDNKLNKIIKKQLNQNGYEVDICDNGGDVFFYIANNTYDLIILDRMLPVMDGLSVLAALRKRKITTPVIIVTALGELTDRIDGLDSGADDYLVKPFAIEELLARIRALLRRPPILSQVAALTFGDLTLSPSSHILSCHGNSCELSKKETELLEYLMQSKGIGIAREMLLAKVWGPDTDVSDGNLDNYISFLRKRLNTLKSRTQIKTIHGVGYRLEENLT